MKRLMSVVLVCTMLASCSWAPIASPTPTVLSFPVAPAACNEGICLSFTRAVTTRRYGSSAYYFLLELSATPGALPTATNTPSPLGFPEHPQTLQVYVYDEGGNKLYVDLRCRPIACTDATGRTLWLFSLTSAYFEREPQQGESLRLVIQDPHLEQQFSFEEREGLDTLGLVYPTRTPTSGPAHLRPTAGPARMVRTVAPKTDCRSYSPPRIGWLHDYDRRGEVALWSKAGPGSSIVAVIPTYGIGQSLIVEVYEECDVGHILYYRVDVGEGDVGWVDVDYLYWRRP